MCRLIGVASSESTDFGFSLRHAPRSLEVLSREHPHGWGVAVFDPARVPIEASGWDVRRDAACARDDQKFGDAATTARGRVLVAHIRKATVGPASCLNTHPFRRGDYVFAHNGTIRDGAWVMSNTSPERAREVEGDTDSERFFAYLLTAIDELCDVAAPTIERLDAAVLRAATRATSRPDFGSVNFVLSNGQAIYAHRFGRTLFVLERGRGDVVVPTRISPETEAVLSTPWSSRRVAALVASEAISDEPWEELPERCLVRAEVGPWPRWKRLVASDTPVVEAIAPG
jgi:predicted glutamine amidotransferase